ncbi:hypothetical protein Trydic_g19389 [Trypoxylus dichotomus]
MKHGMYVINICIPAIDCITGISLAFVYAHGVASALRTLLISYGIICLVKSTYVRMLSNSIRGQCFPFKKENDLCSKFQKALKDFSLNTLRQYDMVSHWFQSQQIRGRSD